MAPPLLLDYEVADCVGGRFPYSAGQSVSKALSHAILPAVRADSYCRIGRFPFSRTRFMQAGVPALTLYQMSGIDVQNFRRVHAPAIQWSQAVAGLPPAEEPLRLLPDEVFSDLDDCRLDRAVAAELAQYERDRHGAERGLVMFWGWYINSNHEKPTKRRHNLAIRRVLRRARAETARLLDRNRAAG